MRLIDFILTTMARESAFARGKVQRDTFIDKCFCALVEYETSRRYRLHSGLRCAEENNDKVISELRPLDRSMAQ